MSDFIKDWPEHSVPKQKLPCCGYEIDCISQAVGDRISSTDELLVSDAEHRSISVCMKCGQWLIINPDLTQRVMTAGDIVDMPDEVREQLRTMSKAIQTIRQRGKETTRKRGVIPAIVTIRKP